ncbi:hypothetical protein [Lampropedia hyalina]|uniref:hypothetical protein n=1 Tax=Lampropedia hyalina TaxID=198706 RepID=UPI0013565BB7|nr:hypothetical protein [Lampropedia hyalina]
MADRGLVGRGRNGHGYAARAMGWRRLQSVGVRAAAIGTRDNRLVRGMSGQKK